MQRSFFISLFFLSCTIPLQAQSCEDAYGMLADADNNIHFISYNTETHVQTRLHDFGKLKLWLNPCKKGFLNESTKTYYFIAEDEMPYQSQLISLDIETGHIKSTMPLGFIHAIDYDIATGKFYGIRWEGDNVQDYKDFICIDPEAQTITSLSSFIPHLYGGLYSLVIDPLQRKFHIWTTKYPRFNNDLVVLTFDFETGTLRSESFVSEIFTDIQYNEKDGKCYGTSRYPGDYTVAWFSAFDPVTALPHRLAEVRVNQELSFYNNAMINKEKNLFLHYCFRAGEDNPLILYHYFTSIDLHTGEVVKSLKVAENNVFSDVHVPMGIVWHPSGCTKSQPPNPIIHIPNLFTPNGDGVNETFEIESLPTGQASLTIYNAWGALVYSSSNYSNNWNAEHQEDGIYYYDLTTRYDQTVYRGWVQVLR